MGHFLRLLGLLAALALISSAAAQSEPRTLWTHSTFDRVTGLALPPNTTYVAAQGGGLYQLEANGSVARSLPVGLIQRFAAAPDGSVLATVAGLDATLRGREFNALWTYRATAVVEAAAVAARGSRTALGTKDGTLTLLDRNGQPVTGQKLDGPVEALGISDDGEALAVSIPGSLLLLDGRSRELWRLPVQQVSALAVAGDGSLAAVGDTGGKLRTVDRQGVERFSHTLDPPLRITALALPANGSLLLVAWGNDVVALGPARTTLWRQTFFQPVEALGLSRDGARAAVAVKGGLVYGFSTGFVERPKPPTPTPTSANGTPAPSPTSAPPANTSTPPPATPGPPPTGLLVGFGVAGGVLAALVLLHKRGLLLLPGWPRVEKELKALPRRLAALKSAMKPQKRAPRPAPKKPPAVVKPRPPKPKPAAPPRQVLRTPPVPPKVVRLLRERAREEKTLENLDYMKGRGLLEEGRYNALREETAGRLKEIKNKLEEAGYRG